MPKEKHEYAINSVSRALNLLKAFSDSANLKESRLELSLVEISSRIGLNPSSTYRLLVTLEEAGFVEQDRFTGRYSLGLACLRLASAFQSQNELRKIALPIMQQLREQYKETVHLARLVGTEVIYLEKLVALLPIGIIGVPPGGRAPAHCTALGKVMLAYQPEEDVRRSYQSFPFVAYTDKTICSLDALLLALAEIRRVGYAFDNGETDLGVRCVSAPIHNQSYHTIAAVSISGPQGRLNRLINEGGVIEALLSACKQITELLSISS